MKRLFIILLTFCYFGLSSGAVFSLHYCMDNLVSVSLDNQNETCNSCGTNSKNDCCKTEFKVLKTDFSQKADFLKLKFWSVNLDAIQHFYKTDNIIFVASGAVSIKINAPPQVRSLPIFIQHCNFRI